MDLPTVMQNLGLILAAGFIGALLARGFKLPVLVGYLIGGVVIGMMTAGRFAGDATISGLANFGVAMLMFTLGIELSFKASRKTLTALIILPIMQVCITSGLVTISAVFLHTDFIVAVFLGFALSLSSTAVVIKMLETSGRLGSVIGEISVSWMLVQDLLVVPLFFFLPIIAGQRTDTVTLFFLLFKTFLVLLIMGLIGRRIGRWFLTRLTHPDAIEVVLLGLVVWVLASAAVSVWLGLTMSLGVFLAGVMLGESSQESMIISLIRPIRDLFTAIFFTSLGLFLPAQMAFALIVPTIFFSIGILVLKFTVSFLTLKLFGYHTKLAAEVAGPIAGVGEFAFLIMSLGKHLGVVDAWVFGLVISITVFSLAASPIFALVINVIVSRLVKTSVSAVSSGHQAITGVKTDLTDHIIICGFGRVGSWVAEALRYEQVPFIIIDYHHQVLREAERAEFPVLFGDATDPLILQAAGLVRARSVIITMPDRRDQELAIKIIRQTNPGACIIARAHSQVDRMILIDLGATVVIHPEFEASLSIIHRILQIVGKPKDEVSENIKQIKREYQILGRPRLVR
jgi:CPA2 family monovalent cation:H+ antiporter-2